MNVTGPMIPDRWSREIGTAMCYAALWFTLRAGPDGSQVVRLDSLFYLLVAIGLLLGGIRLTRRGSY